MKFRLFIAGGLAAVALSALAFYKVDAAHERATMFMKTYSEQSSNELGQQLASSPEAVQLLPKIRAGGTLAVLFDVCGTPFPALVDIHKLGELSTENIPNEISLPSELGTQVAIIMDDSTRLIHTELKGLSAAECLKLSENASELEVDHMINGASNEDEGTCALTQENTIAFKRRYQ